MVIDDHEMVAQSIVRILQSDPTIQALGWCSTAEDGLARARAELPDIVVMDFVLPDMDGAAATRMLRAELPDTKVIMLSGSDRPGAYFAAREAGVAGWVRKTRALQELVVVVRHVADGEPVIDEEIAELPAPHDLVVHYQPVVEIESRRIVGFEALVRWAHPTRGLLGPNEFLPLAEDTGFIIEIGRHVGATALGQIATWQHRYPGTPPLWMSVNLSVAGLTAPTFLPELTAGIQAAGIDPGDVVFEITETVLLEETDENLAHLTAMKDIGVRLALDDFGTAFSSLSYLRTFPFDYLKIDNSFTAELPSNPRSRLLVEAVAQMADSLGMRAIAEGVEREDQADALRSAGWRYAQGYLYSRPLEPSFIELQLDEQAAEA
ncbi:MAG: EAL domain-containing protein [Acidobacteria bacterium]|nr:EAL domain-containing protein [Acidobacteriota bacterium]